MHATGHSSLFCPPACAFPSRWPPAQPHLLCLLQRTRPFPCSRGCATGHWGLAPAPCLWPRGSPSRYAAAAAWAKHGAAIVRNAPCLAQVTLCTLSALATKGLPPSQWPFPPPGPNLKPGDPSLPSCSTFLTNVWWPSFIFKNDFC